MLQRNSTGKRKRAGDFDVEIKCYMILQPNEKDEFVQSIKQLYQSESLCDVTFRVGDQLFHAHRIVLAAANSFLGAMFLSGMRESGSDIVEIDSDPILFRFILDYLYGVSIEVPSSLIVPLLGLSSSYSMMGMRDKLAETLGQHLSIDNCCSIFAAADAYGCDQLLSQAQDLLFSNFAAAAKTSGFIELSRTLIEVVLGSDDIVDCDEALLFEAAARWLEHCPAEMESHENVCLSLLRLVRFPIMDSCLLSDVIKGHPLMVGAERTNLLLEAFEHHALRAAGRIGVETPRSKPRKQSCSFTRSTLLNGHQDAVSALVSLGDWLISGSWDSSIKVWATDTWQCVRTLSDHAGSIKGLCICNGKVVSCSDDGSIMVWSPGTWTCARSMEGHDGAANAVLECRGRLASAGDDGVIKLWGIGSWACEVTVHHTSVDTRDDDSLSSQRVGVMSLEVTGDKLISGGDDSIIRIWNTNNWTCEQILRAHQMCREVFAALDEVEDEVWSLRITGEGLLISGSVDGTIRVWRQESSNTLPSSGSPVPFSLSPNRGVRDVGSDGSGGEEDQSVLVLSSSSSSSSLKDDHSVGKSSWLCENTVKSDGPVYSLCCLEGRIVSAGAGNKISVWRSGRERSEDWALHKWFDTEEAGIWSLVVCKGRLISGGVDGGVRVWI